MERDIEKMADQFKALGDPTRLRILQFLVCCPNRINDSPAATAGEVCCHVTGAEKITSTISHHLHQLRDAGLINIQRNGKHMICTIRGEALGGLIEHLQALGEGKINECC